MPTTPRPYDFIDDDDALARFADDIMPDVQDVPLALDIEEDREHGYHPTVALIQITVDTRDFVIDPLSVDRAVLDPIVEFLCLTPGAVVMHGCRNDVTGLKRDFGVGPDTVCDTQTAARFAGRTRFGLAALLEERFGVQLDKAVRRSNWLRRPLTENQLDYAREDTRYLLPLWESLRDEAIDAGWGDALEEECAALAQLSAEAPSFDPFGWRKIKGAKQLDDDAQRRAAAVWEWRDRTARAVGKHPSRLVPPWAIVYLAASGPGSDKNGKAKGVPSNLAAEHLEALSDALHEPGDRKLKPPRAPRRRRSVDSDTFEERMTRLSRWRSEISDETGLDPGFMAPRGVLEAVARAEVESAADYAELPDVRAWRVKRWGDDWFGLR